MAVAPKVVHDATTAFPQSCGGRASTPIQLPYMDSLDWAAGVLEGEGSFCAVPAYNPELKVGSIQCGMTDPEILHRLQRVLGAGHVYGPYQSRSTSKPCWIYRVARQDDVVRIAWKLFPFMGCRRKVRRS